MVARQVYNTLSQSGTVDDDKENTMGCIEEVDNIFTWMQSTPGECIFPLILFDMTLNIVVKNNRW